MSFGVKIFELKTNNFKLLINKFLIDEKRDFVLYKNFILDGSIILKRVMS